MTRRFSIKQRLMCIAGFALALSGWTLADGTDDWVLHSSQRFGMRFEIPPSAEWVDESWDDADGRAWGFAHAFNPNKRPNERCDMYVFAREGGDTEQPENVRRFVKAFTMLPNDERWREITPEGATNHRRWVGHRKRDKTVFLVFFGSTSQGAVLIILKHPKGHALDHEEQYQAWYDSIETLQDD